MKRISSPPCHLGLPQRRTSSLQGSSCGYRPPCPTSLRRFGEHGRCLPPPPRGHRDLAEGSSYRSHFALERRPYLPTQPLCPARPRYLRSIVAPVTGAGAISLCAADVSRRLRGDWLRHGTHLRAPNLGAMVRNETRLCGYDGSAAQLDGTCCDPALQRGPDLSGMALHGSNDLHNRYCVGRALLRSGTSRHSIPAAGGLARTRWAWSIARRPHSFSEIMRPTP